MRRALGRRLAALRRQEAGMTLVELLVASAMGVVVMGGVAVLVITALKDQPEISKRAQAISDARVVMERLTREIRNGVAVDPERATSSEVSFVTYIRRTSCGGSSEPASSTPAIQCQVTYRCTTTSCSRIEAAPGVFEGTETKIFTRIDDANVFTYKPDAEAATYIGITLHLPNPSGEGDLTVSDGASLRNATLTN
jgi:Tfp pilus assembly protein PilW